MPSPTRRLREPDPLVAARLQAISYADPYVFVHADDVLDVDPATYQSFSPAPEVGGWVPDAPSRRAVMPPPPPAPPAPPARSTGSARLADLRHRLELAGGGLLALLVLGLVAAGVAAVLLLRAQPHATSLPRPGASAVVRTSLGAVSPRPIATVVTVDVTGKVRRPGVYKLAGGARVIDAVRAAGGTLHGTSLDTLNLAAKLVDGQQVAVGSPGPAAGSGTSAVGTGTAPGAGSAVVDVNTATVEQLQTLPGIGPVLAQHIIDYRTQHGPFANVDALQQVSGIGPSKFAQLKDHVSA